MDENRRIDTKEWAERMLASADLGHARREQAAIRVLANIAEGAGQTLPGMCPGRPSAYEQIARLTRNEAVSWAELCRAGSEATVNELARVSGTIVVIQDTTTLSYTHASINEDLGDLGGPGYQPGAGFLVHSSLAISGETAEPIGMLDQRYWVREAGTRGKNAKRRERPYEEKESYKWELGFRDCYERAYSLHERLLFVSDRESDVHYYLMALEDENSRFVVRNAQDRRLDGETAKLHEAMRAAAIMGRVELLIPQRGGRSERVALLEARAREIVLFPPKTVAETLPSLTMNAVLLREVEAPEGLDPVEWLLLTSEPVWTLEECLTVVRWYSLRWTIEEYHRTWKSDGTNVEMLRMQTGGNLLRIAVLMGLAAVRIMSLRDQYLQTECARHLPKIVGQPPRPPEQRPSAACTRLLTVLEWQLLWVWSNRTAPLPQEPPTVNWAMRQIARMGGWMDTKQTGIPGYKTLWRGWRHLQSQVEAASLAERLAELKNEIPPKK